jgi:predicted nucleic acid-binding protein
MELGEVARRPIPRARIIPARVSRFIRDLHHFAQVLPRLPRVDRSSHWADNFPLAMAQSGKADYLVSGNRRGVLALMTHGPTHIVRAREMIDVLGIKPAPTGRKLQR